MINAILNRLNDNTREMIDRLKYEYKTRPARQDETRATIWGFLHALECSGTITKEERGSLEAYALGVNDCDIIKTLVFNWDTVYKTAKRLESIGDTYEMKDNGETVETIADTITNDPLSIINSLVDMIEDLQENAEDLRFIIDTAQKRKHDRV